MSHVWKFGDWADSDVGRVRFVSAQAGDEDNRMMCFVRENGVVQKIHGRYVTHLPDCTGFDWVAPKSIEPPPGYRLVTEGCALDGDMSLQAAGWYFSTCQGDDISELLELGAAKAYARKLEPTYAERQAAWVKEHDVKVGDKVRVLRAPEPDEGGWGYKVYPVYLQSVGEVFSVEHIAPGSVWLNGLEHVVPYFVLEKVVPTYRPFKDAAEFKPHRDRWIQTEKTDKNGRFRLIHYNDDGSNIAGDEITWKQMFSEHVFEDGTPFGVQVNVGT